MNRKTCRQFVGLLYVVDYELVGVDCEINCRLYEKWCFFM